MNKFWWLLPASVLLSQMLTGLVWRRARQWQLVQLPNHRSSHLLPTPAGGGMGIVLATVIAGGWLAWGDANKLGLILILSLSLAVVGWLDDVRHCSARVRFAVQMAAVAGLLAVLGGLPSRELFHGVMIDEWLWLGVLLLAGVWWINLFNFMDGIDGLAAVQAMSMLAVGMGLMAWVQPDAVHTSTWMFAACVAGATLGFLWLNWPPARIFMGDVGSTWLAFVIFSIALLSIRAGWLSYVTWLVLAAVFVTDATLTLIVRMLRGERWYEAHRSHAYQHLSRRWGGGRNVGHRAVTLLVFSINLLWLAPLAWASLMWPQAAIAWLMLAYGPLVVAAVLLRSGRPECLG